MSRPTDVEKYARAEGWMVKTFGYRMRDYLTANQADPISVAIVEVERVIKASGIRKLLMQWRNEDVKSKAGRQAEISIAGALVLIFLQLRLGRATLVTEIADTFRELSSHQRALIGLKHDGYDNRAYDRIGSAIHRLMATVDEFPGRRDKVLSEAEYAAVLDARAKFDCGMRRDRMFTFANAMLDGSRRLLPQELLTRMDGNMALDATFAALYGKAGNPSSRVRAGNRRTANPDGGWYRREGSHGAITHTDAAALKKTNPKGGPKGTSRGKLMWGIEVEIVRMTANYLERAELFPLLTVALSFHIPGEIIGEGARLFESLTERGHRVNLVIVDRAYSNGKYAEYAVPVRLLGAKHVFDYKEDQLGVQAYDPRGFVQVSGSWFLDTLPDVLREADKVILVARNKYKATRPKTQADEKELAQAESLYSEQLARRAKSRLLYKGHMEADWTRRYLIPTDSPDYAKWKAKPKSHQGKTVMMKRPRGKEAEDANAGGLKHEQYFHYGTTEWKSAYAMRNGVESVNRNLKRSQYEDIADPDKRAVRGNTFSYIVIALATVVENLRQMLSFFKRCLAIASVTPKNRKLPGTFWQSTPTDRALELASTPPG